MTRKEFIKEWIQHFAPHLSRKQMNKLKKWYIWYLFSYEMIPKENFLVGDDACKAYDQMDKTNAIASFEVKFALQVKYSKLYTLCQEHFTFCGKIFWRFSGTGFSAIIDT